MVHSRRILVLCAVSLVALRACRADIITLLDGSTQEGDVVREDEHTITLQVRMGAMKGQVTINRLDIKSIQPTEPAPDPTATLGAALVRAAEQQTEIKKAAEAWLRAGDFYYEHPGYSAAARSAYEKVLLVEPDNATARTRLGYVQTPTGWALKTELQHADDARKFEQARVLAAAAAAEDDTVIALRQDDAKMKQILVDKGARARAELPPPPAPVAAAQNIQPTPEDQLPYPPPGTAVNTVIEDYTGLPYVPSVLLGNGFVQGCWGGPVIIGNGGYYGNFGYSGYGSNGYGCSNSGCYGGGYSGLSLGFRGHIGSVHISGSFGGGGGYSSGGWRGR